MLILLSLGRPVYRYPLRSILGMAMRLDYEKRMLLAYLEQP